MPSLSGTSDTVLPRYFYKMNYSSFKTENKLILREKFIDSDNVYPVGCFLTGIMQLAKLWCSAMTAVQHARFRAFVSSPRLTFADKWKSQGCSSSDGGNVVISWLWVGYHRKPAVVWGHNFLYNCRFRRNYYSPRLNDIKLMGQQLAP